MKIYYILTIAIVLTSSGILNATGFGNLTECENNCNSINLIEHDDYKNINKEVKPCTTLNPTIQDHQMLPNKVNFNKDISLIGRKSILPQNLSTDFCNHYFNGRSPLAPTVIQNNYVLNNTFFDANSLNKLYVNELKSKSILTHYASTNYLHYKNLSASNLENILNTDNYNNTLAFIETIQDVVSKGKNLLVFNLN